MFKIKHGKKVGRFGISLYKILIMHLLTWCILKNKTPKIGPKRKAERGKIKDQSMNKEDAGNDQRFKHIIDHKVAVEILKKFCEWKLN